DGADAPDSYRPKTKPGLYVGTVPLVSSNWPKLKPFALASQSQFRPEAPIALTSEQWAADYNEIKDLGGKDSTKRSAQQTEDGRFWLITGQQSADAIVRQVAMERNADYNEIKDLGGKDSTKRSAQQTEDGRFWLITGPQSADPIVRQVAMARKMSVIDCARFMAVVAGAAAGGGGPGGGAQQHDGIFRPGPPARHRGTIATPPTP